MSKVVSWRGADVPSEEVRRLEAMMAYAERPNRPPLHSACLSVYHSSITASPPYKEIFEKQVAVLRRKAVELAVQLRGRPAFNQMTAEERQAAAQALGNSFMQSAAYMVKELMERIALQQLQQDEVRLEEQQQQHQAELRAAKQEAYREGRAQREDRGRRERKEAERALRVAEKEGKVAVKAQRAAEFNAAVLKRKLQALEQLALEAGVQQGKITEVLQRAADNRTDPHSRGAGRQ
jgi:hypothetical protein